MIKRILDTSGIDNDDPEIASELRTDLRRMDHLEHADMPDGCDAYRVKVLPSARTYQPGLHRFSFEIQYGNLIDEEFEPKGETFFYQTETLPMI